MIAITSVVTDEDDGTRKYIVLALNQECTLALKNYENHPLLFAATHIGIGLEPNFYDNTHWYVYIHLRHHDGSGFTFPVGDDYRNRDAAFLRFRAAVKGIFTPTKFLVWLVAAKPFWGLPQHRINAEQQRWSSALLYELATDLSESADK